MIARIIPAQRFPKQLHAFDYLVPEALQKRIQVGQLVSVPLRRSEIFGVVLEIQENKKAKKQELKTVAHMIHDVPIVSAAQLHVMRILAAWYGVSTGTILKMSLLPLQKRKIRELQLRALPLLKKKPAEGKCACSVYRDTAEHAAYLREHIHEKKQTLILLPTKHRLEEIQTLLQQEDTMLWHSDLTQKKQFENWQLIRNGKTNIILGTRGAILLPFFNLGSIIIDYEHDENHKHWDQAPRLHAKDVADLLRRVHGADVHLMSFSVSTESSILLKEKPSKPFSFPTLVDISAQQSRTKGETLSLGVQDAIKYAKGDVFLFLNRRGYGTSLSCTLCGWVQRCETCALPLPYYKETNRLRCHYCETSAEAILVCPECKSDIVKLSGFGTELVHEEVVGLLGKDPRHQILRIDGDLDQSEDIPAKKSMILIGTEKAFPFVRWKQTDVVIFIDVDRELALPEFTATESVWHHIQEVLFEAPRAEFFIQTRKPEHEIFAALQHLDAFYEAELKRRAVLNYPPKMFLVRYFYGHAKQGDAEEMAKKTHQALVNALTTEHARLKVNSPYPLHPPYYRRKYWYGILLRLPVDTWQNDLIRLQRLFGSDWKSDPHPISILSP